MNLYPHLSAIKRLELTIDRWKNQPKYFYEMRICVQTPIVDILGCMRLDLLITTEMIMNSEIKIIERCSKPIYITSLNDATVLMEFEIENHNLKKAMKLLDQSFEKAIENAEKENLK